MQLPFLFLGLTKTERLHKLSTWSTHAPSPFWLVGATVFMKTPRAEWLQWLHRGHVDIFVAINHQAQSGCIHDQPCHLSTLLLLSLWLSHFLSFAFTCSSCSTLNFLSLPPVLLPFPVLFFCDYKTVAISLISQIYTLVWNKVHAITVALTNTFAFRVIPNEYFLPLFLKSFSYAYIWLIFLHMETRCSYTTQMSVIIHPYNLSALQRLEAGQYTVGCWGSL